MIVAVTCLCGGSENLIRRNLQRCGYANWASIPVHQGKEKSLRALNSIPQYPEVEMLKNFIKETSKYAVVLGYDEKACRWADVAHTPVKSKIEAEFIVDRFA